jgi:hypothetical protein
MGAVSRAERLGRFEGIIEVRRWGDFRRLEEIEEASNVPISLISQISPSPAPFLRPPDCTLHREHLPRRPVRSPLRLPHRSLRLSRKSRHRPPLLVKPASICRRLYAKVGLVNSGSKALDPATSLALQFNWKCRGRDDDFLLRLFVPDEQGVWRLDKLRDN